MCSIQIWIFIFHIFLFSDANSPAIAGRLATKRPNEMSQQSAASPKMAKM